MSNDKGRINAPNILFCEGNDACYFLIYMLQNLCKEDSYYESFDVKDFGGIEELSRKLGVLLKMPNFDMVNSIIIIRDAETDSDKAKCDIVKALNDNNLGIPEKPGDIVEVNGIKVAYLLFPSLDNEGSENGTLEDLCLRISCVDNKDSIVADVEEFLKSEEDNRLLSYPRIHKNRIHMFISLFDKYVGSKIGEAGKMGLYDWNSKELHFLKDVMRNIGQ